MDSHLLLADAHRKCLQLLSTHRHYEGLQQALRKSVGMPSKLKRHLTHLDIAFAWSWHITIARVNSLVADLNAYLDDDVHEDVVLARVRSLSTTEHDSVLDAADACNDAYNDAYNYVVGNPVRDQSTTEHDSVRDAGAAYYAASIAGAVGGPYAMAGLAALPMPRRRRIGLSSEFASKSPYRSP